MLSTFQLLFLILLAHLSRLTINQQTIFCKNDGKENTANHEIELIFFIENVLKYFWVSVYHRN